MSLANEIFEAIESTSESINSVIRHMVEVATKHPLKFLLIAIIVYGSMGLGGYALYKLVKQKEETQRQTNLSYSAQLNSLNQIEKNLGSLIQYIETQKIKLKESQDVINQLQSEHERLKPIIDADKQVIDAIFGAQEARQQKGRYIGYAISFTVGVISSLTASFIVYVIILRRRKRKEATTA